MINNIIGLYLIISIIICIYFGAFAYTKGSSVHVRIFFPLCIIIALYIIGYLLEITTTNPDNALFWMYFQSISSPFIAALWIDISYIYLTGDIRVRWWKVVFIYSIPVITMILRITNELHYIYYRSIDFNLINGQLYMVKDRGVWNYVQSIHAIILTLITIGLYIVFGRRNSKANHNVANHLLVGMLINIAGLLLNLINFGTLNLNYVVLSLPITLLIFINTVYKYDFLEIKSLARDMVVEYSDRGVVLIDSKNKILDINPMIRVLFCEFNNVSVYQPLADVLKDSPVLYNAFSSKDDTVHFHIQTKGEMRFFEMTSRTIVDNRNIKGYVKLVRDVTENHKIRESLFIEATTDYLSGLHNRRYFMNRCKKVLKSKDELCCISFFMIDIDRFKKINDTYGHDSGDEAIRTLAFLLRDSFRSTDVIGRLGGEEFGVLVIDVNDSKAFELSEEFRKRVEVEGFETDKGIIFMTVSIGITTFQAGDSSFETILKEADKALYQAKNTGRNKTVRNQILL